ncbi:MAG: polysaccharide pyruvyl transferase family protein [Spirochaetia bacterium]|nr:polysaccharide pyruvyl transferase family protein [Spirochaetia bacterium]
MHKLGGLTFHASHNYGSVLQAFALQQFIKLHFPNIDYHIINFRSENQKRIYNTFFDIHSISKSIFRLFYLIPLKKKLNKFENFISSELDITEELNSLTEFDNFDFYLSGSDQIWNSTCKDTSWHYYLDFVPGNKRKIAFAASFGPSTNNINKHDQQKIKSLVERYDFLSVRENESKIFLEKLGLKKNIEVLCDPTLLLDKETWYNLLIRNNHYKIPKEKYILFYPLNTTLSSYKYVKKIEKLLGLKVITTLPKFKQDFFGFYKNMFDVGPIDFLSLIMNAELVISTSFHGCVFSSIFNKPFFALDVINDNRIQNFLSQFGMEDRNLNSKTVSDEFILNMYKNTNFAAFNQNIQETRKRAYEFLKISLS